MAVLRYETLFDIVNVCLSLIFRFSFISFVYINFFSLLRRSESESEEEEEEIPLLSEEEMNKLGAKLVKAEIMGNTVSGLEPLYSFTVLSPFF